jgi:cellulose synthase/poly-beta-1,6-N-acetylglucosamine synthase-like glycosyltransferase
MNQNFYFLLLFIIQLVLYIYLTSTALYIFIFSIASCFKYSPRPNKSLKKTRKFAVLIPCYQEDDVIIDVILDAFEQNYPSFDVVVIADNFQQSTIEKLKALPIILFNEKFDISTKTRSLNFALRELPDYKYDAVIILDADNIMEQDFLNRINDSFENGFLAIQGHRIAKNTNTHFALLDAISEEINNRIFRKGHRVFGLSSALIGSAMAFEYSFFKNLMKDIEVVGGFDKELELRLLNDGHKIEYLEDAYVYDEKVQNLKVFARQRRRWLSAQFHYFGIHFIPALKALILHRNIDYFNKAYQYVQLPRILLAGLLFIILCFSIFFNHIPFTIAWSVSFLLVVSTLLISMPAKFYNRHTLRAIAILPQGFFFMFLSLLRIKGANKKFIHTKHTYNAFQIKQRK